MRSLYRRVWKRIGGLKRSKERKPIRPAVDIIDKYANAWQSDEIPARQWVIAENQLKLHELGSEVPEFRVFLDALVSAQHQTGLRFENLLEIGCSSGYYGKVLHSRFPDIGYTGIDFSPSFVDFGLGKFPGTDLRVGDTTNLDLPDRSFDVVVSGSVLLHVYEWRRAMSESIRVARNSLILHRTPVSSGPTTLFTKTAYGQKMIEWTFNEEELLICARDHGFGVVSQSPVYREDALTDDPARPTQFTYVLVRC